MCARVCVYVCVRVCVCVRECCLPGNRKAMDGRKNTRNLADESSSLLPPVNNGLSRRSKYDVHNPFRRIITGTLEEEDGEDDDD